MGHRCTFCGPLVMSPLFLLCCLLSGANCGVVLPVPELPMDNYSRPGDLMIGIVTSVHKKRKWGLCGDKIYNLRCLQRIESMAFAVEEINNRSDLLPNITLGFIILDDCSNPQLAKLRALQFVQNPPNYKSSVDQPSTKTLPLPVVAVIGGDSSSRTTVLASLLSLYKIPVLSYMASGRSLEDKELYPFFSRTIPSNRNEALVTVSILQEMGWTYVSVIFSEGPSGEERYLALEKQMKKVGYCMAAKVILSPTTETKYYEAILDKLRETPEALVVVLYVDAWVALKLFQTAYDLGLNDNFIWLITEVKVISFYDYIGTEAFMDGVLAISFNAEHVPRFDERFRRMTLRAASTNPWFQEYVSSFLNCSLNISSDNACNPDFEIGTSKPYYPERTVSLAMDAVYAWAYALDEVLKNCTDAEVITCVNPNQLLSTLREFDFYSKGHDIRFDKAENGLKNYEVLNFVWDNHTMVINVVGEWSSSTKTFLFFRKHLIKWGSMVLPEGNPQGVAYPESVCSKPCPVGHEQVTGRPHCCFQCLLCADNERTVFKYSDRINTCEGCPTEDNFTWPDEETRTVCLPIKAVYVLDLNQAMGMTILIFGVIVFCCTAVTAAFYITKSDENLIQSSSLGMGLATLLGHGLMCILMVSFVLHPTDISCCVITLSIHLSFPLSYALMLVRANCIYYTCTLKGRTNSTIRVNYPKYQATFIIVFVVLQVQTSGLSIVMQTPMATLAMYDPNERQVDQVCSIHLGTFVGPVMLNILGITLCAIRAFQIRTFQGQYHEPKFIKFHIFCTFMIWFCLLPTYFLTRRSYILLLSAAIALYLQMLSSQALLFLPKLFAIYFLPSSTIESFQSSGLSLRATVKLSFAASLSRLGIRLSWKSE